MKTIKTGRSTTSYKRYTPVQLASIIRQLQRQCIIVSKLPEGKTVNGKSVNTICAAYIREIKKVALVLRSKVVDQINVKIKALKTEYATMTGVKFSSPKSASVAVKRLKAKMAVINECRKISTLIKLSTVLKLATFKNPKVSAKQKTTVKTKTTKKRGTAGTRRTTTSTRKTKRTATGAHHPHVVKYKRQTKHLKKQVHKLKKRNSFMTRLVNKFRRKVAKLQRSYKAANAKPRWKVLKGGRGTSNVVHLNRSSTWKTAQRRAS